MGMFGYLPAVTVRCHFPPISCPLCSLGGDRDFYNEELLYRMFGVNAELLIDHAWGWEPVPLLQIRQVFHVIAYGKRHLVGYQPFLHQIQHQKLCHLPDNQLSPCKIIRVLQDLAGADTAGPQQGLLPRPESVQTCIFAR